MVCERITGDKPTTCPWSALRDPFTVDVVNLAKAARNGDSHHLASVLITDPPNVVWEGVQHYVSTYNSVVAHDRDVQMKERKRRSRG